MKDARKVGGREVRLLIAACALLAVAGCEVRSEPPLVDGEAVAVAVVSDSITTKTSWAIDTTAHASFVIASDSIAWAYQPTSCLECKVDSLLSEVRALRDSLGAAK